MTQYSALNRDVPGRGRSGVTQYSALKCDVPGRKGWSGDV